MDSIVKTFLGYFLILLLVFAGFGIVGGSIDSRNATNSASNYADRIEASNFSNSVIETVKKEAEERGYDVGVTIYENTTNTYARSGRLILNYKYEIPILNIAQNHAVIMDLH